MCRYDSTSGGEREIQRTMLELLNQLDGFDAHVEVKVSHGSRCTAAVDRLHPIGPAQAVIL